MAGTVDDEVEELLTILGPQAQKAWEDGLARMAVDATMHARVAQRHERMAVAYGEEHPNSSHNAAQRAGRRAYLLALLVEASGHTSET